MITHRKLELKGVCNSKPSILIESNQYIPISVALEEKSTVGSLHWRLVDPRHCLLDIKIDHHSGTLLKFALTNYNGNVTHADIPVLSVPLKVGIPFFDLAPWPIDKQLVPDCRYADYAGKCYLHFVSSTLYVELFSDPICEQVALNESVMFEFNVGRELVRVKIDGLNFEDWLAIMQ